MNHCATCGHELGVGRFCTSCGQPVDQPVDAPVPPVAEPDVTAALPAVPPPPHDPPHDPPHGPPQAQRDAQQDAQPEPQGGSDLDDWRTDTAERPLAAAVPDAPPPTWTPPGPARFPLFADEVDEPFERPSSAGPVQTVPVAAGEWVEPSEQEQPRRPWGWWIAIAAIVVLVVVLGIWLLSPGDGRRPAAGAQDRGTDRAQTTGGPTGSLTDQASVVVPATAAAGQDTEGKRVTYVGKNMLDGVPETAWRMPGDGTGAEIRLTLPRTTHLSSVGLINGYAKQAQRSGGGTLDWYHGNRRIEKVEWVFDDGSRVAQDLEDTTAVQSTDVDVDTRSITLRLISVSKPGTGPAARDFTAISDLSLINRG